MHPLTALAFAVLFAALILGGVFLLLAQRNPILAVIGGAFIVTAAICMTWLTVAAMRSGRGGDDDG